MTVIDPKLNSLLVILKFIARNNSLSLFLTVKKPKVILLMNSVYISALEALFLMILSKPDYSTYCK